MASFVVIDAKEMSLTRFEVGGEKIRKTHAIVLDEKQKKLFKEFDAESVAIFRINPPDWAKVDPPPRPTNPPSGAGTVRKAVVNG